MPRTLCANLFGVGLPYLGGSAFDAGAPIDGRGAGVIWPFLTGDSGRGNEGRGAFFPTGLEARPGPTDWLNFGSPGVGGVKLAGLWVPALEPPVLPGVRGNEFMDIADSRLTAFDRGKKMPAPGFSVAK